MLESLRAVFFAYEQLRREIPWSAGTLSRIRRRRLRQSPERSPASSQHDVRFSALTGLNSDIAPCPKGANGGLTRTQNDRPIAVVRRSPAIGGPLGIRDDGANFAALIILTFSIAPLWAVAGSASLHARRHPNGRRMSAPSPERRRTWRAPIRSCRPCQASRRDQCIRPVD